LLWGERDEDKARQSLRHALHQLRRALADAVEVTNDQVRVAGSMIEVDASLLERDVAQGRLADGVQRWAGEFLHGAEDAGSETYRAWLEREREGLRRTTAAARASSTRRAESRLSTRRFTGRDNGRSTSLTTKQHTFG
jgi:DNA-binding SARP family transcriptional activator